MPSAANTISSATAAKAAKAIFGNAKQIVNAAEHINSVLVIMVLFFDFYIYLSAVSKKNCIFAAEKI